MINWYKRYSNRKIYRLSGDSKRLYWKPHIASDFINGTAPVGNNGVGIGGDIFYNFDQMCSIISDDYWVCPVILGDNEIIIRSDNIFRSKVSRIGIGDFAAISYWRERKDSIDLGDNNEDI